MKALYTLLFSIALTFNLQAQMSSKTVKVSNQKVILKIFARTAKSVNVVAKNYKNYLGSDTVPLKFNASTGVWLDTFSNIAAGFYPFRFLVDGAEVYDYQAPLCFSEGTWKGCIEVPDISDSFSIRKAGPFGNIDQNIYKSSVTNKFRTCQVYLPAEYSQQSAKTYKTVYLFADIGENEDAWITQGRINDVLDNAINSNITEPCIVVLENKNSLHQDSVAFDPQVASSIIVNDLVPYIDSIYRTDKNAEKRTIAGCWDGSLFALNVAASNNTVFKNLGMFGLPLNLNSGDEIVNKLKPAGLSAIWLCTGENDSNYAVLNDINTKLTAQGVAHNWRTFALSDNWLTWRRSILEMLKK